MLPKRIDRKGKRDNYRALALYVADARIAQNNREKTLHSWYTGGEAGNYLEGMIEVEMTQGMNTRCTSSKTYHLMISFHPEDEANLTLETLVEIEMELASVLGFTDHQRHCGYHINTANPHLHVAYNMINPRKFTRHSPHLDYPKLNNICRALDLKYGLIVDPGMELSSVASHSEKTKLPPKIRTTESHTGQETLYSYIQRLKPELMARLGRATTWTDIQIAFLKHGLVLKVSGNGLAIKDRHGKHSVKASDLDRTVSKAKLETRFGPFQAPPQELLRNVNSDVRYTAAPIHKGAEREALYVNFQQELGERQRLLQEIRREEMLLRGTIKEKWARKREAIRLIPMFRHDRQRVMEQIKQNELAEYEILRSHMTDKKTAVRTDRPYTSWSKYLQHQATQGQETALTILRSSDNATGAEIYDEHPPNSQRLEILDRSGLSNKHRQALLAVIKMREVLDILDKTGYMSQNLKYVIDAKGTIIFSLPDGGKVCDTGLAIRYSLHSEKAGVVAEKYYLARWAQVKRDGNTFEIDFNNNGLDQVKPRNITFICR